MEGSSKTWLALAKGYNTKRSKIIIMTLPRSFLAFAYKFAMLLIVAFIIFYSTCFALLVLLLIIVLFILLLLLLPFANPMQTYLARQWQSTNTFAFKNDTFAQSAKTVDKLFLYCYNVKNY